MLNLLKTFRCGVRRRGSALLIVLGFLSFMIISGVSFAIYMRIERQASSNYRHTVTARHMLNTALVRAIEEVDAELRRVDNKSLKFPVWQMEGGKFSRVLASALPRKDDNAAIDNDARVLSLEALSYLPPFLVNDVRRYAAWQGEKDDKTGKKTSGDPDYYGAKWRKLDGKDVNGRYAYVCVNVSDMFNINTCRAQYRDATTNRVSLGHLFQDGGTKFYDEFIRDGESYFLSLHDFHSACYDLADPPKLRKDVGDSGNESMGSPFHEHWYSGGGDWTKFNKDALMKQVFITDGIAKPEPADSDACNIWLHPPIAPALLAKRVPDSAELTFAPDGEFWKALTRVFTPAPDEMVMAAMIKDYLDEDDEDNVPSLLNAPCLEMVPMISQVTIPDHILKYSITADIPPVEPGQSAVTVYTLHLLDDSALEFPIEVELVWPFKNAQYRKNFSPSYSLEVEAALVVDKSGAERSTRSFNKNTLGNDEWIPLPMKSVDTIPEVWKNPITNEKDCFRKIRAYFQVDKSKVSFEVFRTEGGTTTGPLNGFASEFRLSLCMLVRIKEGDVWVDSVPHLIPPNELPENLRNGDHPKLYFQTERTALSAAPTVEPQSYGWGWTSLEVADPRFNHKASNWVKSDETFGAAADVNESTRDILGQDGRDADIFMFVANTGVLQSPGELGFIIRPHNFKNTIDPDRKFGDPSADEPEEKENMFRTIRLYDHGGVGKDEVYKYFYAQRPDGVLPGARVDPLSDIDEVLEAAIWDTPLDYWIASTNNGLAAAERKDLTFTRDNNYFGINSPEDSIWATFRDAWVDGLDKIIDGEKLNASWEKSLSDYYGDAQGLAWYSNDVERKDIFGIKVPKALHEIDRKMLYSFSLDSFSDRQQLFLYFIRAEVTMPAYGGGAGMQSLAGGRAVALVWRDPYPRGFTKDGAYIEKKSDWYPQAKESDKADRNTRESPWRQYPGHKDSDKEQRYATHHDTRVLFFQQLVQ